MAAFGIRLLWMAENKPIPLRLRPIIRHYLDELVKAGAYGTTRAGIMRRFIENGVVAALQGGVIERKHIADFPESDTVQNDEED
jgi:hypothetical protein